ncbi:hypothetical protein FNV43_RR19419 [Rhamnella rubrinervis]|uniref:Uncharacterized protein n=1 Tax=Rhamnella rubrinervis TaxID=2594499 RepID=A0A8K0E4G0_9ROSA|nr:hypothetical protein FNV43_RR19419 [Rhamnella rubrinervis]
MSEQQEPQPLAKPRLGTTIGTSIDNSSKVLQAWKVVVLADLNVDPPLKPTATVPPPSNCQIQTSLAIDESSQDKSTAMCIDNAVVEGEAKRVNKLGKCRSRNSKVDFSLDYGADADGDMPAQGIPSAREEKSAA